MAHGQLNSFLTPEKIEAIKEWIKHGTVPQQRGLRKHGILGQYELEGNRLIYIPLDLEVVEPDRIDKVLKEQYSDLQSSIGKGVDALYRKICEDYVGITRDQVAAFLKKQPSYQIRLHPNKKVTNKVIAADYPTQKVQIDLIDMGRTPVRGYKYIVNIVDVATRYIWCRAIKSKTAKAVCKVLEQITEQDEFLPKVLMSDNGTEFFAEVTEWCENNGIKQAFTKSYSPLSLVESINQQVRRMLSDCLVRENSTDWPSYLHTVESAWNSSRHGGLHYTPEYLFLSHGEDVGPHQREVLEQIVEKAKKKVAKNESLELEIGNVVRVATSALSTKVRKAIKSEGTYKHIPVMWSPELYVVRSVIAKDVNRPLGFAKHQYTLKTLEGVPVLTEALQTDAKTKVRGMARFYASELQLVAPSRNKVPKDAHLPQSLLKLNKLEAPTKEYPEPTRRSTREKRKPDRLTVAPVTVSVEHKEPATVAPVQPAVKTTVVEKEPATPPLRRSIRERRAPDRYVPS